MLPPTRSSTLASALLLGAAVVVLAAGVGGEDFRGREARGAALCPADMVWVPAGSFYAGAEPDDIAVPDYVPDIVRDPRPRGLFATAHFCIDRLEWPGRAAGTPAADSAWDRPVADVTWIQARVACEAVGKRLCSEDEWVKSCGGVLGWRMPYGDEKVVGLCHADVQEEGSYHRAIAPGSRATCRSPYGTFDQEGNISEWVEDRRSADSLDRWVLGGTMWPGVYGRGCQARHAHPEVAPVAGDDGFRCCLSIGASPR